MDSSPATSDDAAPFVPCNPISDWLRDGRSVPARVEAHLRTAQGDEIVLVGPDPRAGAGSVRGFIGRDGRLRESFEPELDPSSPATAPKWTFSAEAGGDIVNFSISGAYDEQDEFDGSPDGYAGVEPGEWLEQLPLTRLALAGLEFECSRSEADGWQLSNDPPRHDPPSACVEPQWHAFHCVSFPEAAVDVDYDQGRLTGRLSAEVLAVGSGRPPGTVCRDDVEIRLSYAPNTELTWARLGWEGSEGLLVMSSPGVGLPFGVGRTIDIDYMVARSEETLVVRDPAGSLLLWLGEALSLEGLVGTPDEFALAQGPEQCATLGSGCMLASQLGIDFKLGDNTERLTYGTHRESNGFVFVHGGYDRGTVQLQGCYDGAPAGVTAAVWAVAPPPAP